MQLISKNHDDFPLLQTLNPEPKTNLEELEEAVDEEAVDEEHQDLEAESESCFWDSDELSISKKLSNNTLTGLELLTDIIS